MATKQGTSGAKHRKPGDWKAIAKGRDNKARYVRTGRGLTNVPDLGDTGSAAYRRRKPDTKSLKLSINRMYGKPPQQHVMPEGASYGTTQRG